MSKFRDDLVGVLPYARRYARALTGEQQAGDTLVANALRALLAAPEPARAAHLALYGAISSAYVPGPGPGPAPLPPAERKMLLLTTLEELSPEDAADAAGLPREEGVARLSEARSRLRAAAAADVLIIEDEPIIAMDIEELVRSCGHRVVGVASTEAQAVEIGARTKPTLILADINLGSGGDGKSAVARILRTHTAPVIFVTAYPERLLTGADVEPVYVITKPFEPMALAVATYQAVTRGAPLG